MIVSTQGTLSERNRSVSISALSIIVSAFTALVAAGRPNGHRYSIGDRCAEGTIEKKKFANS